VSRYVYIEGEMNGSITIQANQDTNTTKTFFTGFQNSKIHIDSINSNILFSFQL